MTAETRASAFRLSKWQFSQIEEQLFIWIDAKR